VALRLSVLETATGAFIRCQGELDLSSVEQFRTAVGTAVLRSPSRLHISCNLSFIDSPGVRAIVHAAEICERAGIRFTMEACDIARRMLDLCGASQRLSLVS